LSFERSRDRDDFQGVRTRKGEPYIDRGIVAQDAFSRVNSSDTGNPNRPGDSSFKIPRLATLFQRFRDRRSHVRCREELPGYSPMNSRSRDSSFANRTAIRFHRIFPNEPRNEHETQECPFPPQTGAQEGRGAPSRNHDPGRGRLADRRVRGRKRALWEASVYLRGQRRQAARYSGAVEKHDENGVATTGGRTQANSDAAQGVAEPGHGDPAGRTTSILSPDGQDPRSSCLMPRRVVWCGVVCRRLPIRGPRGVKRE